jgi:hypothetical protein
MSYRSLNSMKTLLPVICLVSVSTLFCAGSADQDKAFTDKYKTAYESKDTKTLESFLYTTGADPGAVEFYKMMMTAEAGGKLAKIELVTLTPDEIATASKPQDAPTGGKVCLPLKPTKKLVLSIEAKSADGSSSSKSESFVAEKDGKMVIPVPGPCK